MRSYFVGPWELSEATAILPETPGHGRILLIESQAKGSALPYHRHKLVLVLSALRHFRDELIGRGFEVDHRVAPSYADGLIHHARQFSPDEIVVQEPAEWGIDRSIRAAGSGLSPSTRLTIRPDRRFLTSRAEFTAWADGRKLFRMEDFYRWQRKRLGILMTKDGKPAGGQWNFDPENRKGGKALQKHGLPAPPKHFAPDAVTAKVIRLVNQMPDHWGTTDGFGLPTNRKQALATLDEFIESRLQWFGPFQDAMVTGDQYGYQARISAAMNIGLLHPKEIVDRAVAGNAPVASVEGFVRQIVGWREYVNGIYWRTMPDYRHQNYFEFTRPLPQAFWDPDRTDLTCLKAAITSVKETGYAHHIHRLMILANFATLAGVNPLRLSEWFWAGFADAMEWVELPNVIGMGSYGDGGLLGSKPYVSSGAYIDRMSTYCGGCRYNRSERTGPNACPFNYLYWTFLDDIKSKGLDVGQRMQLVLKGLDRIPARELADMRKQRTRFLDQLEPDSTGWQFHHDQG